MACARPVSANSSLSGSTVKKDTSKTTPATGVVFDLYNSVMRVRLTFKKTIRIIRPSMKHTYTVKLTALVVVASAMLIVPAVSARAHGIAEEHAHTQAESETVSPQHRREQVHEARQRAEAARETAIGRMEAKKAEVNVRLEEKRKEVCERREQKVNAITDRSVIQARKHLGVFQKIEERVAAFYQKEGLRAESYIKLAAEVDAKEAAAVAAIEATSAAELDCDAEGQQRELGTYIRNLVREHQEALKDYRTAIKNLIAVVAQAQRQADASEARAGAEAQGAGDSDNEAAQPSVRREGAR